MEFKFGMVADYVGQGANNKLIIVGQFDTVYDQAKVRPIPMPPMYLLGVFEGRAIEGTEHDLELRLTDAEGNDILPRAVGTIQLTPQGPGRPLKANVITPLFGLHVPETGDYEFHFYIGGRQLGVVPLYVIDVPFAR